MYVLLATVRGEKRSFKIPQSLFLVIHCVSDTEPYRIASGPEFKMTVHGQWVSDVDKSQGNPTMFSIISGNGMLHEHDIHGKNIPPNSPKLLM